MEASS